MSFLSQFSTLSFPLLGLVRIPDVTISSEVRAAYNVDDRTSNLDILKWIVQDGYLSKRAAGKFANQTEEEVVSRLKFEFSVFEKTGIIDYLLIVFDLMSWCDSNGIPRGPGRGSVTGSLACFCSGITKVNPLTHNLNFTRFISEARAKPKTIDGVIYAVGKSMCDIDCDISFSQRDRVLAYLEQKYPGRTAKICNRLELTGKMALKDVLKTYLGYSDEQAMGVSGNIESIFGKVETLTEALERHPELRTWVERDPKHREAFDIAQQLIGLGITKGVHASGVFISYTPIDGSMPIELSKTKENTTSYEMSMVAELGVKLDCLALKTLDVIDEACRLAGIKADDIDVNHPSIYHYLSSTDQYYGIFQIESGVTKEVVTKMGPRNIDDLASALAIGRPGSLCHKDELVTYVKTGKMKEVYPPLDEILRPTGGIIIYQETINEVCQRIYGMSAIDADEVRRAISKKVREDMAKWEPVLFKNGEERGVPRKITEYFWQTCNASADYLFSGNHCYAYTYITAQTAYLKANHTRAFMLSLFKMARHEANTQECISQIIGECRKIGVEVLPPDILRSEPDFSIEKDAETGLEYIRFGLNHIRGISDLTMSKLATFQRNTFTSKLEVFEAAKAAGVNIAILASLILSGCLSWKGVSRTKLLLEAQLYGLLSDVQKTKVKQFINEAGGDLIETLRFLSTKVNEKGKPLIPEKQMDTLRRNYTPYFELYQHNSKNEELASYMHEMHYLGYSFSSTLFKIYSRKVVGLVEVSDILKRGKAHAERVAKLVKGEKAPWVDPVTFVTFVQEAKMMFSQKDGTPYLKLMLADDSGTVRALLYGAERVEACKRANEGELPKEGQVVICEGGFAKDGTMIFLESVIVQPTAIKTNRKVDVV